MAVDTSTRALLIAMTGDAAAAVYAINRLKPECLCFFVPESSKALVESDVQPQIAQMPRKWDWVVTPEPQRFMACYQVLARTLPDLLRAWDIQTGELVLDLTGATPSMAAAVTLASIGSTSRIVALGPADAAASAEGEAVMLAGQARVWQQGNPWDEAAAQSSCEGAALFNRGFFGSATSLFHQIEARVSGGQKPLYHALADMAEGYGLWERFHYRQAWDKLKISLKALDMALVWGGPSGLKAVLPSVKQNAGFLEKLVLDPQEVKESVAYDLLAHARRRVEADHYPEAATVALLRALEAFAQWRLFKQYKIKTWDVQLEQLPEALREPCRTCFLSDLDGKYKLSLHDQFRTLAGLGDPMGQTYVAQWPKMKPLLDAGYQSVLGHGFEPIKPERFQQLYEIVVKLTGVGEQSLPKFPTLNL